MREYGASMLRVAQMFVSNRAVAEEVVQEAWLGVLKGIGRFEGRSSLKTWLFRIVANTAKTRGAREGRTIPFSALGNDAEGEPAVDPDRFLGAGERFPGHWGVPPQEWGAPEGRLLARERMARELSCAQMVELVTSYLEGALGPDDRERFEEHLVFCDGCDRYLEQMRLTIEVTGRLEPGELPPALEERLLEAFRGWRAG